jgi:hypothetical protein
MGPDALRSKLLFMDAAWFSQDLMSSLGNGGDFFC